MLTIVLVLAAGVGLLIAFERNTATSTSSPVTPGKPFVPAPQPKNVRFTRTEAASVLPVVQRFVHEAVDRKNMHSAWAITAPALKADTPRKDWDRGENTEIVPYPVDHAKWELDYNYGNTVGFDVAVFPRAHSGVKVAMIFFIELKRVRHGGHKVWLVDQWQPSPGSAMAAANGSNGPAIGQSPAPEARLSSIWLLLPLGVLSLIFVIPLVLAIRGWHAGRRARIEHERSLPHLPDYGSRSR